MSVGGACPQAVLLTGKPVQLIGLQAPPELNLKRAVVLGAASAERLRVVLYEGGPELALRPENVQIDAERFIGTSVQLHGLVSRPELNGANGTVMSVDNVSGGCGVRVAGMDEPLSINLANVHGRSTVPGPATSDTADSDQAVLAQADAVLAQGRQLLRRGEYWGAIKLYEICRRYTECVSMVDSRLRIEGDVLGGHGIVYFSLGQFERAIERHTEALSIHRTIGYREGESSALRNLGHAHFSLGRHERAIQHYTQALDIATAIGDRPGEGCAVGNLGNVYVDLGQYERAVEHHTRALNILKASDDRLGEGGVLGNLGAAYSHLGQYERAIEHHTQALDIYKAMGDREGEGNTLSNIGNDYISLGQYERAIEHHTKALDILRAIGNPQGAGKALGNLGNAYFSLGQYETAIDQHTKALNIISAIGNRQGEGKVLSNLGNACFSLGQYETAIEHHAKALDIQKAIGDRVGEGTALGNLGVAYYGLGQYERALEHHTKALDIAKLIGNREGEGTALGNLGNAHRGLGQNKEAIEHHTQALNISREIGDRRGEGIALGNLGDDYSKLGEFQDAVVNLSAACRLFDELWVAISKDYQRATFGDTATLFYRLLQLAHVELAQHVEALQVAEHAHARSLELVLATQRCKAVDSSVTPSPAATMPSLGAVPAATPQPRLDAQRMQELAAQQGAAIIVFSQVSKLEIFAWVIGRSDAIAFHRLVISESDSSLTQLVELTRRTIGARGRNGEARGKRSGASTAANEEELLDAPEVDEEKLTRDLKALTDAVVGGVRHILDSVNPARNLLRRCHDVLIAPLECALEGEERLLLIPDRDLYALPFAALLDGNGKHLIERYVLSVSPSVGTVFELETQARAKPDSHSTGQSALVVGNPYYHGLKEQLRGAFDEAEAVAGMLSNEGKTTVRKLLGPEATKKEVVDAMRSSELIHLAAHGEPDGVLLSGDTPAKIKLSMGEVQTLELPHARLVVLSACETFRGELRAEGIVGISRAFLCAGALAVVSSLWIVGDGATRELMTRFYEQLIGESGGDVAVAMRNAMVSMLRDRSPRYHNPLSWSAFVLFGAPAPLAR